MQDRNEHLFYRLMADHIEEFLPIIYTPTVGQAMRDYSPCFQRSRGVWSTPGMQGRDGGCVAPGCRMDAAFASLVVTDNESILALAIRAPAALGSRSVSSRSIPLRPAFIPAETLPVSLDVGTDNQVLLDDPLYLGRRHPRLRGAEYDAVVDEFVRAVMTRVSRRAAAVGGSSARRTR